MNILTRQGWRGLIDREVKCSAADSQVTDDSNVDQSCETGYLRVEAIARIADSHSRGRQSGG